MENQFVTGVTQGNQVGEFWGENWIDLRYEQTREDAQKEKYQELLESGLSEEESREETDFYIDNEWEYHVESDVQLYGNWIIENEKYHPDPSGEYSAIYDSNDNIIQVVYSRYVISCHKCSPCYPLQGDIDTPGNYYMAYCLPPELMSEEWQEENTNRVIKI